jgi:hypothetical protein
MDRAYGTFMIEGFFFAGLKSIVTKLPEPTALGVEVWV